MSRYKNLLAASPTLQKTAIPLWGTLVDDLCGLLPEDEYVPTRSLREMMATLIELAVTEREQEKTVPPALAESSSGDAAAILKMRIQSQ